MIKRILKGCYRFGMGFLIVGIIGVCLQEMNTYSKILTLIWGLLALTVYLEWLGEDKGRR